MSQSAKSSVIEQIRALQKQQSDLLEAAKAEALAKANAAIAELEELGFAYSLVAKGGKPARDEKPAAAKRRSAEGPCPICGFATTPAHDGRAHRGQKAKAPFSAAELAERSLAKVG